MYVLIGYVNTDIRPSCGRISSPLVRTLGSSNTIFSYYIALPALNVVDLGWAYQKGEESRKNKMDRIYKRQCSALFLRLTAEVVRA